MAKKKEETEGLSVMKQFDEMKRKHPDAILLFRAGNYYETYREDAIKAKQILGLDTESRVYGGVKTNVASFQHDALDTYLPKLVRAGMRVAICEQLEDPKIKKKENEAVKEPTKETSAKTDETQLTNTTMPRKKKEKAPEQEQPKAKAETKNEVKSETKAEAKKEQKTEAKAEQK